MRNQSENSDTLKKSSYNKKILGVLGVSLALGAGVLIAKNSRRQIDEISNAEFEEVQCSDKEEKPGKTTAEKYDGYLFTMDRLPEMAEESPDIKGRLYVGFPEKQPENPRAIVYLHGNGGQGWIHRNEVNSIRYTKEMQEEGDEVIYIAPEDLWSGSHPKGQKKSEPGRWHIFSDPDTLANMISFTEQVVQNPIDNITLAAFSGGNVGITKILRTLEEAKEENEEADRLYKSIKKVAYFDSATGSGAKHIAKWMAAVPDAEVMSCYNKGTNLYNNGNKRLLKALKEAKIDPSRIHTEEMKKNMGHGVYEEYFKRFTAPSSN